MRNLMIAAALMSCLMAGTASAQQITPDALTRTAAAMQSEINRLNDDRHNHLVMARDRQIAGDAIGASMNKAAAERIASRMKRMLVDVDIVRETLRAMR